MMLGLVDNPVDNRQYAQNIRLLCELCLNCFPEKRAFSGRSGRGFGKVHKIDGASRRARFRGEGGEMLHKGVGSL